MKMETTLTDLELENLHMQRLIEMKENHPRLGRRRGAIFNVDDQTKVMALEYSFSGFSFGESLSSKENQEIEEQQNK